MAWSLHHLVGNMKPTGCIGALFANKTICLSPNTPFLNPCRFPSFLKRG